MDTVEFYSKVEDHNDLDPIGMNVDDGQFVIHHKPSKITSTVSIDAVEENDWDTLEAVITCKREPTVLRHMTRVCGYYSRVENWNASKLGELKARQEGRYCL